MKIKMKMKMRKVLIKSTKVVALIILTEKIVINGNILPGIRKKKIGKHYLPQLKRHVRKQYE